MKTSLLCTTILWGVCMKKLIIFLIFIAMSPVTWADLGEELIKAVSDGDLAEVENLLDAGADVNLQNDIGVTALMMAVKEREPEIVVLLIAADAVE